MDQHLEGGAPPPEGGIPAPGAAAPNCSACQAPLESEYYTANGQAMCNACLHNLHASMTGGSGAARFFRAFCFGAPVAVACAVANYLIAAGTDRQFALVFIAMGAGIGAAIKAGAQGRGGWLYQSMAVVFTYAAISLSFMPIIYKAGISGGEAGPEADADGMVVATTAEAAADEPEPAQSDEATSGTAAAEDTDFGNLDTNDPAQQIALIVISIIGGFAAPIFTAFADIKMFLLIVVGLVFAWTTNKRPKLEIAGPFAGAPPPLG